MVKNFCANQGPNSSISHAGGSESAPKNFFLNLQQV